MSSVESASILPREAAIAAALAGAVVVLLAYASGFGLRTPLLASQVVPTPSSPVAPAVPTAVPAPVVLPAPVSQLVPEPVAPSYPAPLPTPSRPSTPVPSPVEPTPTSCPPGLLDGLLTPVNALVDGLLGADLSSTTNLVGCTVGSLLGSTCCDPAVAARKAVR